MFDIATLSNHFLTLLAIVVTVVIVLIVWGNARRNKLSLLEQNALLEAILEQQQQQSYLLNQLVKLSSEIDPHDPSLNMTEPETQSIPRFSAER